MFELNEGDYNFEYKFDEGSYKINVVLKPKAEEGGEFDRDMPELEADMINEQQNSFLDKKRAEPIVLKIKIY